ncbi:MAG TPA: putative zinc-binding metallopeptidase [Lacipirellulaceae bacterium]|jgi:hypothetical protein
MNTYQCICNNRLFFNNTVCVSCAREVAWCEACRTVAAIEPQNGGYHCLNPNCGATVVKCRNYSDEQVCNRVLVPSPLSAEEGLCKACRLNDVIPDLAVAGNRERWAKLELAKRRLLYQLDELDLKYAPEDVGDEQPLVFDFKAGTPEATVLTGHADGRITINIDEADSVERERVRKQMHEPHRTLIGHMRHEVGHYYWMTLVAGKCEDQCNAVFGDYRNPPYTEALQKYYETGPATDWQAHFVSAYATAHPWEDFAETWGFYCDMWAVLTTMSHHLPGRAPDPRAFSIEALASTYQQLGIFFNEVNRTMGLKDLVPEVITPEVIKKLAFVDSLVGRAQTVETIPVAAAG